MSCTRQLPIRGVSYLEVSFAMPVLYLYQLKAEQIILDLNKTNSRKKNLNLRPLQERC